MYIVNPSEVLTLGWIQLWANLIAYACKLSWDLGNHGAVEFVPKSKLIKHYEDSLGALHIGNQRMVILPMEALNIIRRYFLNKNKIQMNIIKETDGIDFVAEKVK